MANFIKKYRLERGMTLSQLAELCNTSVRMMQYLESGERGLTERWIRLICAALDVSPTDLIASEAAMKKWQDSDRHDQGIDEAMFKQAVTYAAESMRGRAVDAKEFMGHVFKIYGRIKADPSFVSDESRLSHIKTGIDTALAMLESAAPAPTKPEKTTRN